MTLARSEAWSVAWNHVADGLVGGVRRVGRASSVEIEPGLARIVVAGRGDDRTVLIGVRPASPATWAWCRELVSREGRLAQSIELGEVPDRLVVEALAAGAGLVPSAADLAPECSCGAWDGRCGHLAAALDALGQRLSDDPERLIAMRNGSLGGMVPTREGQPSAAAPGEGVAAVARFRRKPGALPVVAFEPPASPPRPLGVAAPPESGVSERRLLGLIADVRRRAAQILEASDPDGVAFLLGIGDSTTDAVRRFADRSLDCSDWSDGVTDRDLADAAGLDLGELERRRLAFLQGGPAGLAAVTQTLRHDAALLDPAVRACGGPGLARPRGDRVTRRDGSMQLRLDGDGRWWRFVPHPDGGWVLDGEPATDPTELV